MQKWLPYLLPVGVILIGGWFFWRWFSSNTVKPITPELGEGIKIEELSTKSRENILSPAADTKTIILVAPQPSTSPASTPAPTVNPSPTSLATAIPADSPSLTPTPTLVSTPTPDQSKSPFKGAVRFLQENKMLTLMVTMDVLRSLRAGQSDDQSVFSGDTASPAPENQSEKPYVVWLRQPGGKKLTKAFTLEDGKGGLWGSASVDISELPLEVLVTTTEKMSEVDSSTVLKGIIPASAASPVPSASPSN